MSCTLNCSEGIKAAPQKETLPVPSSQVPASPFALQSRLSAAAGAHAISRDEALVWLSKCPEEDAVWILQGMRAARPQSFRPFEKAHGPWDGVEEKSPKMQNPGMEKDTCKAWLLKITDEMLTDVIAEVAAPRWDIFDQIMKDVHLKLKVQRADTCARTSSTTMFDLSGEAQGRQSKLMTGTPRVALTSKTYFAKEGDTECTVEVMRLGSCDEMSSVRYSTKDWTAKSGESYVQTFGELVFKPGENLAQIVIPMMDDDCWHTTLEFSVDLLSEGSWNCGLDPYLATATVKTIDNDAFPTNKYKEFDLLHEEDKKRRQPPFVGLFLEYCKMNMQNPAVRRGTWKLVVLHQLHNLCFVGQLFLQVYLVDFILKEEAEDLIIFQDKVTWLILYAALSVLPTLVLFRLDQAEFGWGLPGTSRIILQASLLKKFLNYDAASRASESKSEVLMAMTRDSFTLVHEGYMNLLQILKETGTIASFLAFQVASPFIFTRSPARPLHSISASMTFPILMIAFLRLRFRKTAEVIGRRSQSQDASVDFFYHSLDNYRLVADYSARSSVVDSFEALTRDFNACFTKAAHCQHNNLCFPRIVTLLIVSAYSASAGYLVLTGDLTLGLFLAEIMMYSQMGAAWCELYKDVLQIQTCCHALRRITRMENLQTDLGTRCVISKSNRSRTLILRQELRAQAGNFLPAIDLLPIEINGLQCMSGRHANLMESVKVSQGQVVALVGGANSGKATLLKVLGGAILPVIHDQDDLLQFFMPSHLRVLHISFEPMFLKGSLLDNLAFGATENTQDGDLERVQAICKKIGLTVTQEQLLRSNEHLADCFSQTKQMLCSLARALVANPEVLCIHKPSHVFDEKDSATVMECLVEHVRHRGLCMPPGTEWDRRPRTCVFTSSCWGSARYANLVIHVCEEKGLQAIQKEDVTPDMLW